MGGEIGSTTILRGFRVSVEALDAFLAANGVDETYGYPPWHRKHPDNDNVSKLLYKFIANTGSDADKDRFRVMIPAIPGSTSQAAYVTYAWVTVLAHREIDMEKDLPAEVPAGFESLRREILSFGDGKAIKDEGKMGVFAVVTHGFPGIYTPKEYLDRGKVPQFCDQCDAAFTDEPGVAFTNRQKHRIEVHGARDGINPMCEG